MTETTNCATCGSYDPRGTTWGWCERSIERAGNHQSSPDEHYTEPAFTCDQWSMKEVPPMPSETNRPRLLPCPFCGAVDEGALVVEGDRWHQSVYCNGCETGGPTKSVPHSVRGHLLTEEDTERAALEAMAAWNRRS